MIMELTMNYDVSVSEQQFAVARRDFLKAAGVASLAAGASLAAENFVGAAVAVHRQADGVVLDYPNGRLRLQVFSDRIIRVLFSPRGAAPKPASLSVVATPAKVKWQLTHEAGNIVIKTAALTAKVDEAAGTVHFFDAAGTLLTAEAANGRHFEPFTFKDVPTYRIMQKFVLAADEAVYGLGQHTKGLMDYRGASVHLEQRNRHVAVPVMLSSRGYGIFWDNPAITDVSVAAASPQWLSGKYIFDEHGRPGALTGRYYAGDNFQTLKLTRRDKKIDFIWNNGPAKGMGEDNFSIRWNGFIEPPITGEYLFTTLSDDGIRLWVDGKRLVEDWLIQSPKESTGRIYLEAGKKYPIKIEYFQGGGGAEAHVGWQWPEHKGSSEHISWRSQAGFAVDYYMMAGPALDDVIGSYRELTGHAPMFGRWAWGFWQCKEHYNTQAQILGVAATYRSMHIPIDNVIQDWFYWNPHPWGSNEFDLTRYPNVKDMMKMLHSWHVHMIISVWAKFAKGSSNYRKMDQAGVLLDMPGTRYYDPFNPRGRALYWQLMNKQLFSLGIDGWWLDASEPELNVHWGEFANYKTFLGYGEFVYNAYPLMHTMAVYQGQRATTSAKRVFILTRSAFAGQQRNSAVTWSGDTTGTWATFKEQIPAGLNFAMSGIPYWNTDIGGFFISGGPADPAYQELFVRWYQFGAFCPMFRVHGTSYPKEMWRFGPHIMPMLVKYDKLRYRLLPYIYSVAWQVTSAGYTMMRALVMDFREDVRAQKVPDQFMFGPALMIAPVTEAGAKNRSVYMPAGSGWQDFWTGESLVGGANAVMDAPLDTLPIAVRAGAIIPLGPVMQYSNAEPVDPIELRVYTGADGSFTLYEDEDDNYNYEKGVYATITFNWSEADKRLTIGARKGEFPGMLKQRTINVVFVRPGHGIGLQVEAAPDKVVAYSGDEVQVHAA